MTYPLQAAAQHYQALKTALLKAMPDLAEDPECLLDTLEGLTNVHDQLASLLRSAKLDEAFVDGLKLRLDELKDRKLHLEQRAQKKRQIALHFMADLDIKKLMVADMSVTRRIVPPSVVIVDELKIPQEYLRVKYVPNKTAIKKALMEGTAIEGCMLSNTSETLFISI